MIFRIFQILSILTFSFDKKVNCLGLNAGCTGFVDALEIVDSYFQTNLSNKALIINSDTYSKFLNDKRSTRTLFSDGATATIVEKAEDGLKNIKNTFTSLQNSQKAYIKFQMTLMESIWTAKSMQFAIGTVLKDILEIIKKNVLFFFPHQASKLVLDISLRNYQIILI